MMFDRTMLPYWFYLTGSLCFAVGTAIVLWRNR